MADQYQSLRELALVRVLASFGITTQWRPRKDGSEMSMTLRPC